MGPAGGDELNRVERGSNYGWPLVSNGSHYGGAGIPDHAPGDGYNAPEAWWTPVIAPAGFIVYSGDMFPFYRGHGFIGGLASQALVRVEFLRRRRARGAALPHGPAHPRGGAGPRTARSGCWRTAPTPACSS
jgi:glucose/arabinose dehydrogenase